MDGAEARDLRDILRPAMSSWYLDEIEIGVWATRCLKKGCLLIVNRLVPLGFSLASVAIFQHKTQSKREMSLIQIVNYWNKYTGRYAIFNLQSLGI